MKTVYEKYYKILKDKNLTEKYNQLVYFFDYLNRSYEVLNDSLGRNFWIELGKDELVNNVFPMLVSDMKTIQNNVVVSLRKVCNLIDKDLINLLERLKEKENLLSDYNENRTLIEEEILEIEKEINLKIKEINDTDVKELQDRESFINNNYHLKDINEKKKLFIGNIDNPNEYTREKNYISMKKHMRLFNNTTGEEVKAKSTIRIKKGERLVLTVKLPENTGMIKEIHRTSADGDKEFRTGRIIHAESDVSGDIDNPKYVNYKWNKYPEGVNLHKNHYEWIIYAREKGLVIASQTCEYTDLDNTMLKAMITINVKVED